MSVAEAIESKVRGALPVAHLELENESHRHNVPANSETHFKLVLVSDAFQGQMPVRRHQAVYQALAEELKGPVHALALHLFTPDEWRDQGGDVADSPDCRGGDGRASERAKGTPQ
jgi:BolA family transcriptional regulator, general stress-responsive regulator